MKVYKIGKRWEPVTPNMVDSETAYTMMTRLRQVDPKGHYAVIGTRTNGAINKYDRLIVKMGRLRGEEIWV